MENRCLYCYQTLEQKEVDYHYKCSEQIFGNAQAPILDFGSETIKELAKSHINRRATITGVQPKLSLEIEQYIQGSGQNRFTVVGLWGNYILKPPVKQYPFLPEIEDLTMHLAKIAGIQTAEHALIRLKSGELAYITKRFDRSSGHKLAMEDMCQLTETLTENKYKRSMEKVGKEILKHCTNPIFDAIRFFELTVFCYLTGNADMHLKNFSLLTNDKQEIIFSPAYDLVATKLVTPEDTEEMAIPLNAKKSKLKRKDFLIFGERMRLNPKTIGNSLNHIFEKVPDILKFIQFGFLPDKIKSSYRDLIEERFQKIS
ncbi:MAG: HipA domain-containing protein [Chitinophagales bacterium]